MLQPFINSLLWQRSDCSTQQITSKWKSNYWRYEFFSKWHFTKFKKNVNFMEKWTPLLTVFLINIFKPFSLFSDFVLSYWVFKTMVVTTTTTMIILIIHSEILVPVHVLCYCLLYLAAFVGFRIISSQLYWHHQELINNRLWLMIDQLIGKPYNGL